MHLLDYDATYLDASTCFHLSRVILHIHSDGSYLLVSNVRRIAVVYFFLVINRVVTSKPQLNVLIHVFRVHLKNFIPSTDGMQIKFVFANAQEDVTIRNTLEFLGYLE